MVAPSTNDCYCSFACRLRRLMVSEKAPDRIICGGSVDRRREKRWGLLTGGCVGCHRYQFCGAGEFSSAARRDNLRYYYHSSPVTRSFIGKLPICYSYLPPLLHGTNLAGALSELPLTPFATERNEHTTSTSPLSIPGTQQAVCHFVISAWREREFQSFGLVFYVPGVGDVYSVGKMTHN